MRGGFERMSRGCGVAVGILTVAALVVHWRASVAVDEQVAGLRAELRAFEDAEPAPRIALAPSRPGNAVIDYQVIEWVFSPRESWKEDPPGYLTGLGVARGNEDDAFQLMQALGRLEQGVDDPLRREQEAELAKPYRFLIERVRQGLSRERCDWSFDPAAGLDAERPSFFAYRAYAGVVAIEARAHPERAFQLAVELAAFGRDVARHPDVIALLVGGGIEQSACKLIGKAAERTPLPAEAERRRLLELLEALPPLDMERSLAADRLGWEVYFAEACGHEVMTRRDSEALQKGMGRLNLPMAILLREWRGYEQAQRASCEAVWLPRDRRQAASDAVKAKVDGEWHFIASLAVPDLVPVADSVDDVEDERALALETLRAGLR